MQFNRDDTRRQRAREYYNQISSGSDLNALFSGWQACDPSHSSGGIRYHFLLHYVLSGEGRFRLEDSSFRFGKGSAFIVFPELNHLYQASAVNPWSYCWVAFAGTKAREILAEAGLSEEKPVFRAHYSLEMASLFGDLRECLRQRPKGYATRADGILYLILAKFISLNPSPLGKGSVMSRPEYVERAIQFIKTNFQRKITVESIARFIGYNRSYFSSLFKDLTGKSLQQYLVEYRMERARDLLAQSQLPIKQISQSVGYREYFVFAKQFKRVVGRTPSVYREKSRKQKFNRE